MKRFLYVLITLAFILGFGSPVFASPDYGNQCYICHGPDKIKPSVLEIGAAENVLPPDHSGYDPMIASGALNCGSCHAIQTTYPGDHSTYDVATTNCNSCHEGWEVVLSAPVDIDGDGVSVDDDCNDNDAAIYPGAEETPYDGIDQDCDGSDLDDVDQDGFPWKDANGKVVDCNDQDAKINPDATEIIDNGVDENCDGIAEVTPPDNQNGFVDDGSVDDGSSDDGSVDDGSGTDMDGDGDCSGGCDGPKSCNPCKWTIPCSAANEPSANLNIDVEIDVIPCVTPNYIMIAAKGFITVVIKGDEKLNVRTIDTGSILLANAKPVKFYFKYVSCHCGKGDLNKDMVLVFRRCDLSLDPDATEITLTGKTLSGASFTGTDTVKVIDCNR